MRQTFFAILLINCIPLMSHILHAQSSLFIIGHRGAMGYEVENSISSIRKAIEIGVQMIEIDVFRCQTGEIVVFHDDHLNRLANKDALIEDLTLSEIKELRLSNGEKIPTLKEVMELTNGVVNMNIELKGKNTANGVYDLVTHYIQKNELQLTDMLISSFHWEELSIMRNLSPTIKIGVLTQISPVKSIHFAKEIKAFSIHPRYNSLTKNKVEKIHEAGFYVYAYTVNLIEDIEKMMAIGADGIFTNYPDIAQKTTFGN